MDRLEKADETKRHEIQHELQGVPYPIILMQAYQMFDEKDRQKEQIVGQIDKWIVRLPEGER